MPYKGHNIYFEMPTDTDLSTASAIELRFYQPDGTTISVTGSYTGSGNLTLTGTVLAADNDQSGEHEAQAFITISGVVYPSNKVRVYVDEPIPAAA